MAKGMDTQILKLIGGKQVKLNSFQHLSNNETLKQVQGDLDQ